MCHVEDVRTNLENNHSVAVMSQMPTCRAFVVLLVIVALEDGVLRNQILAWCGHDVAIDMPLNTSQA